VRYLDGGHQSGFNHVVTNPGAEKRLFQVKGKKNIRVRQVDPLISSMNKGDVFILDINNDIFVYVGEKSKNVERLKAISVANQIRDQDHNGRGRVEIIGKRQF
ncbi:jg4436, partial [Pararge aegeria aegeria]